MKGDVARDLLRWYRRQGRDLPWRRSPDPYGVWISEIMLQQTTVPTAIPYYEKFMKRFPTVEALAGASQREVLALWSGLGYYERARNMLRAARIIRRRHGGKVPDTLEELEALPGVGPYTAGAILSIGHDKAHVALDGNIIRVVSRLGAIEGDTSRVGTRRRIESLVMELMPPDRASAFNQALMDLGAMICTPRDPSCLLCPVSEGCLARERMLVDRIPAPRPAARPVAVDLAALVVRKGASGTAGTCLLVRREGGGLMEGMWEFPLVPHPAGEGEAAVEALARQLGAKHVEQVGELSHTITRHKMRISVYRARAVRGGTGRRVAEPAQLVLSEPASRLATRFSRAGRSSMRWSALDEIARGASPVAITATARKIARMLAAESSRETMGSHR